MSVCVLIFTACAAEAPVQYEDTENDRAIFKTVDGTDIGLDILYPTNRTHEKNPTVLVIHGGGWVSGSCDDFYNDFAPLCDNLRESGVTVVGISYRLALDGLTWRDCLADCEDALEFLVKNSAEYDIDTSNIGIVGYSAGGQLALMTAIETGNQVKYCVSMSGPTVLSMIPDSPYYSDTLAYYGQLAFGGEPQLDFYKASPVIRLSRKCSSEFLLINGTEDNVVPVAHAEAFQKEAQSFAIPSELIEPEGMTHFYSSYNGFSALCDSVAMKIIDKLSD